MRKFAVGIVVMGFMLAGCQTMYQSTMEKLFGVEKRQFLKDAVGAVSKDQKKAQEEFKDAMTTLKELYGFQGGDMEKMYNKVKSAYDHSQSQADTVHKRIEDMDGTAKSMFAEWENEIKQYSNPSFAQTSRSELAETKDRYGKLYRAVRNSEDAMKPVLRQLKDHVLYLKHNLNAQAIGSLKGEAVSIQQQMDTLIQNMNASIVEADSFINELVKGK